LSDEDIKENYKDLVRQYNILNQISKTVASTLDLNKILKIILTGVTFGDGFGFNRAFLFLIDRHQKNLIGRIAIGPASEEEAWKVWGEIQHTNYSLEEYLNSEKFLNEPSTSVLDEKIRQVIIHLDEKKVLWQCLGDGVPRNVNLINYYQDQNFNSNKNPENTFDSDLDLENGKSDVSCQPTPEKPYCYIYDKNLIEPELLEYIDYPKFCIIPLISRTIKVGILIVDNKYNKRDITDDDIKFLLMLGQFAASSIRNTIIYNDLKDSLAALEKLNMKLDYLREYNEKIIESIPVSILVIDKYFKVTLCNENCSKIMRAQKNQIIGRSIDTHSIFIDGADLVEEIKKVMDENKSEGFHKVNIKMDGRKTEEIYDVILTPFKFFKDTPEGVVLIIEDITATVKLKKELSEAKKLSELGKLSATIAHEIRNPLIAIGGYAIRLKRKYTQNQEIDPEAIDIIINEVSRLETIVNEILDYAADRKLEFTKVDLSSLMKECINLAEISAEQNDISIDFSCGCGILGDCELFVTGDYNKLKQAFLNIINNAVEASKKRSKVTVLIQTEDNYENIMIKVHNYGYLGSEEIKHNIFLPFYTTKDRGTGLGLTITKKIIEQHNGSIGVESSVENGTTFTIKLPLLKQEQN